MSENSNLKKILIIGSGGREHAIGWKFKQDAERSNNECELYFIPGNAGTAQIGTNISVKSPAEMCDFAKENQIDLTFVGPEAELAAGIVDLFKSENLEIFGPDK